VTTHWYDPFWDPTLGSQKKVMGSNLVECQVKTHAGPSANEHDFWTPTNSFVRLSLPFVLQKKINQVIFKNLKIKYIYVHKREREREREREGF
jgi:hypothetical protein